MSAIAASNVTYSLGNPSVSNLSVKSVVATLTFGNGSLTYPTGGVPLLGASLGLPNSVQSIEMLDMGNSGYVFSANLSGVAIRMFEMVNAAPAPLSELATSVAPASVTIVIKASGF
jgi:hypothetical protein